MKKFEQTKGSPQSKLAQAKVETTNVPQKYNLDQSKIELTNIFNKNQTKSKHVYANKEVMNKDSPPKKFALAKMEVKKV